VVSGKNILEVLIKRLKHIAPVLLICFVLNLLALKALRDLHQRTDPGVITNLLVTFENKSLDYRFILMGKQKPTGKIGILAIDEKSIQKFGRWPFPRKIYEQAFVNLKKSGVDWIGFDVVWDQPERPLLEDAMPQIQNMKLGPKQAQAALDSINKMRQASLSDASIAAAIRNFERIVLGYYFYAPFEKEAIMSLSGREFTAIDGMQESVISLFQVPEGSDLKDYSDLAVGAIVGNTPVIASSSKNFGFFNNDPEDDDAIWRSVNLVKHAKGALLPSMSLKMASSMLGRPVFVNFDRIGVESIMLPDEADDKKTIEIPVDPVGNGKALINHLGPSKTLRHISLADAFDNSFSDQEKAAIKGMSFIMGPTAIAINDLRANPFDSTFNGVEQHATVIDNIVSKRFLSRPKDIMLTEVKVLVIFGFIFAVLLSVSSAFTSALFLAASYVVYYYIDKHFWFSKGIWVFIGLPYMQITGMFLFVTLYKYFVEERERRKVKGAFQHYLSPAVMEQVLSDPDRLKLGGERRECTMFFSDVRGFTGISEALPPEKLVELMNDYLSPMTDIILKSGGVLDKYIGDAIMAFWGAPIDNPDQTDTAVTVVLRMLEKLEELRKTFPAKGFPVIDIGCGLNTGVVSVGNMGSAERFAYTVMGDAVNLCARLESITKEYGVRCVVSEYTVSKLKNRDSLLLRDIDDIVVKGKKEAVKIYELMHPSYFMQPRVIPNFIGEFEMMRKAYRSQDWLKAKAHLQECLIIRPEDGPSNLYVARIREMEKMPHIENWDGVHVFKHK